MIALFDRKLKFLLSFKQEARAATLTNNGTQKMTVYSYSYTDILSFSLCTDNIRRETHDNNRSRNTRKFSSRISADRKSTCIQFYL